MTEKKQAIVVIFIGIFLVCVAILMAAFGDGDKDIQENSESGWGELCYLKTIQPGETINENGPGEYQYTLILTTEGIEVYVPCDGTE